MNKKNHFESYEAACADRGLDPAVILPDVSNQPEWLQKYTLASIKLAVITDAINQGRVPKDDEWMYVPVFRKDTANNNAGFGFPSTDYDIWISSTAVGERLSFFTREDAEFFGKQFIDLHRDHKIIPKGN